MKKSIILIAFGLLTMVVSNGQDNQRPEPPKPPTPEAMLKNVKAELDKHLQLTSVQKEKILSAFQTFFVEIEKNRSKEMPPPPPPPVKKEIAEKLSKERDAKIKAVLSEEQFKEYQEIEKKMRPKRPNDGEHQQD